MTRADSLPPSTPARTAGRWLLAAFLVFAGVSHLTFARREFRAQVPPWVPMDADGVVVASGVAEVGLGAALVVLPRERSRIGWIVAAFFTAVFPGNVAQWRERRDAFGLTTDRARFVRLFFQPVLIALALWSTRPPRNPRPGRRGRG
ncbi:membrane protein [Agromyces tropicus]|uniref:Membrane protein n=1 Tax=Agromyces tropicus TaxID=555371 RepID=A0ABN2UR09_9MICO